MSLPAREPDEKDGATLSLVGDLLSEARQAQKKYLRRWNRFYRTFRNQSWSNNRARHLPAPQSPQLFPTFHTLTSYMTDQYPTFYVSPDLDLSEFKTPPPADIISQRADDMGKLLASWWVTSGSHIQTQTAILDALLFGCGILKTGLDLSKCKGLGEATMVRVDPYDILPDPSASCFEDARYVLEVRRVPLFEVMARFPERGHLVAPDGDSDRRDRPKIEQGFDVVSSQNMSATGVSGEWPGTATSGIPPIFGPGKKRDDYTKTVRLVEAWIRGEETIEIPIIENGERKGSQEYTVPYWEFVATANGVVLTPDTSNPFDHKSLPYVRLPHVEIGEFWGMSMSEQLLPAQVALNRLLAAFQMNAELAGNPIFLDPESSGLSRTQIHSRPGGRLTVNTGATQFVRWLDPPQMSRDVTALISYWQDAIDRTSGITAVARGSTLRRREAAASVDAVQEASFSRIRAVLRNYEEALRGVANQVVSNMVQFYVEPRLIPLVGPEGASSNLQLGHKHFYIPQVTPDGNGVLEDVPLTFSTWAVAGSTLALSRAARLAEAFELRKFGAITNHELLKSADYPDADRVSQEADQMLQQGVMVEAIKKGQGGT